MLRTLKFTFLFVVMTLLMCRISTAQEDETKSQIKPAEVTGFKKYLHKETGLSFEYPENWEFTEGKDFVAVYSLKQGIKRWPRYDSDGAPVAKITVSRVKLHYNRTFEEVIDLMKNFLEEKYFTPMQELTIDGTLTKTTSYEFELKDGLFKGAYYFAAKDSGMATVVNFEAFGSTWDKYKPVFDKIVKGMTFASSPTDEIKNQETLVDDIAPPTMHLTKTKFDGFSIGMPGNMSIRQAPGGNGSAESSFYFDTDARADCSVRIDKFDAAKTTDLKKIVENSRASFKNAAATKTTLAGKEAYTLTYSPATNLSAKVWFVMHNSKLFRIIVTWNKLEANNYLPALEKSAKSIRFK